MLIAVILLLKRLVFDCMLDYCQRNLVQHFLLKQLRNSCSDSGLLAQELVPIACQRILMHNSKRLLSLPPPFSQWMNSLVRLVKLQNKLT
jgi:hypothetical protein